MIWGPHSVSDCMRRTLMAIVVMSGILGLAAVGEASCGDHLDGRIRNYPSPNSISDQIPQRPAIPCQRPECRGLPDLPVPAQTPVIVVTLRHDLVSSETAIVAVTCEPQAHFAESKPTVRMGFRHRLERPPQSL